MAVKVMVEVAGSVGGQAHGFAGVPCGWGPCVVGVAPGWDASPLKRGSPTGFLETETGEGSHLNRCSGARLQWKPAILPAVS